MARIINVIHLPHLVSYKAFKDSKYRCCTVCNYKVMIETDDGRILAASALDDFDLKDFDIDEAVRKLSDIKQSGTKEVCGETVPLYVLTLNNTTDCWILPPMAEEIEYVDGKYYVSNESASDKYVFGKYTGGHWCRAYDFNN